MPIHVLSRDGESISGSQDTLKGRGQCACAHPCTVPGRSEYLGILGYSDGGEGGGGSVHVPIHVLSRDGQSISGYSDWGGGGRGGEMLPMLVGGWQASASRGEEAGRFREVAGVSIVAAGGPRLR